MEGEVATPDSAIAELASRQHGVISTGQLLGLGLDERAIANRVASRRLHRVHRGVSRSLVVADVVARDGMPITSTARTMIDLRLAIAEGRPGALSPRELRKTARQANVLGLPVDESSRQDRMRGDLEVTFHHRGRAAFQDDRARGLELRRLGYEVLHLSEKQINEEADRVAEVISQALAKGLRR